jgi:GTP cyclohydrolase I
MLRKTDVEPLPDRKDDDEGTPVSVKIRERLNAARKRFNANDNIAEFIQPGELEALLDEVEVKMKGVLESLVIDVENDHNTDNTARRVAKMYVNEVFRGRYVPPPPLTEFPNAEHLNELMIVGPITVRSACSHHFCPIIGKLWIGVMPNEHTNVIGLSKYARLAEWVMGRPQIQEEAIVQLADLIQEKTRPDGLALVMEAEHFCMAWRGVKEMDSKMINSVMRGVFLKDPSLRREFLSLLAQKELNMLVRLLYAAAPSTPAPRPSRRSSQIAHAQPGVRHHRHPLLRRRHLPAGIEGGRDAISDLYGHIQRDARHKDVVLLHYEEISERRFGGWTMGQVNLSKLNASTLLKYSEKPELDPYKVSGKVSLALLEELMATAAIVGRH